MKKFGAFLFVSTLLLTGCGKSNANKVTCTATVEEDGKKVTTEVIADLKDNKVSDVSAKMTFEDEESAKETCSMLAFVSALGQDEGKKLDYKCDGKTISINNYDELSDDGDKVTGLTKDEFIDSMKKSAASENDVTCK